MYPIVAPITTGQYGPEIKNLQDVILYLLETGIINIGNSNLSITELNNEREQSFFGDTTTGFVDMFKTQYTLQSNPNEIVNQPVADAMNGFANSQFSNPDLIRLSGIVSHASGNLLSVNYTVRIEQILFDSNVQIGTTQIDDTGYYELSFMSSTLSNSGEKYAFRTVVIVAQNEEYPSKIEYINLTQRNVVISIRLDIDTTITAEYSSVKTKVEALIGQTSIENVTLEGEDSQGIYLANAANEGVREINALVFAHKLSVQLDALNPEFFYGLIRQNLPNIAEQLLFQSNVSVKTAINLSIEYNIIAGYIEQDVDDFVSALKATIITRWNADNSSDVQKTITFRIYKSVLNDTALTNEFLSIFFNYEGDVQSNNFWQFLKDNYQDFGAYLKKLKVATILGVISTNNPALVSSLLAILDGASFSNNQTLNIIQGEPQPELLAGITLADWTSIITVCKQQNNNEFIFPDFVEGQNDQEKIEFYSSRMFENFVQIYPIYSIASKITTDQTTPFFNLKNDLDTFLSNNLGFDIRAVSILGLQDTQNNPYNLTGVQNIPEFIEEIASIQRLSALTSSYEAMAAMVADGVVSAFHISKMGETAFSDAYEIAFGTEDATSAAYDIADSITTHVIGKAYEVYADVTYESYPWSGIREAASPIGAESDPPGIPPIDPYAEWRVLFGSLDGCTCCHCESVYSPSAYLVDTLNFLKKKGGLPAWDKLVNSRRPDIKNIELTCDNANVPVPYIDIVNELLEDMTSTGGYVYARQTKASAEYQRAVPEYFNSNGYYHVYYGGGSGSPVDTPYTKLKAAQYPWTLPYNVYRRQIDTHLNILGVNGYELVQRLSNKDLNNSFNNIVFCTSYLNTSNEMRDIITTGSPLSGGIYKDLQVHYGLTVDYTASSAFRAYLPDPQYRGTFITIAEATWMIDITNRVDVFLQQTKLTYRELLELLDCYFLNPIETTDPVSRKFAILNNASTADVATCNLYELKIQPVTVEELPPFLDKLHRFVRLSRALGWHYYELDIALRAVGKDEITTVSFRKLVQLKYLTEMLKLKVEDACILFQNIEILPYRDYHKEDEDCELIDIPDQYTRIFRNPALANANTGNPFPSTPPDGTATTEIETDKFRNIISGIISLSSADTELLLQEVYAKYSTLIVSSGTKVRPNIEMLSYIYRQSILIKALRISVSDWAFYIQWLADANYFGNIATDAANNTATIPITIESAVVPDFISFPYNTIRFANTVRLFKNAGFKIADLDYLLLDKPANTIADDKMNGSFATILSDLRADLFKKWYPQFSTTSTNASAELLTILAGLIDEQDAHQLMSIVDRELDTPATYSSEEYDLIDSKLAKLLPDAAGKLADTASGVYLSAIVDRYALVYDAIKASTTESSLKPSVLNILAKAFKLNEPTVQILLNDVIIVSTHSGYDIMLDADFVNSNYNIERWVNAEDQFIALLQLHKASLFINKFNLGGKDIQYLWAKNITGTSTPVVTEIPVISKLPVRAAKDDVFVPGTSSETTFRLMRNLLQWMQVRAFTGADINILFNAIENNSSIIESIAAVFKLGDDDINSLIVNPPSSTSTDNGILDMDASLYQVPISYLRIIDCLEMQHLMPAPMLTLYNVAEATRIAENQSQAGEVIHLVKAPYTDKQWLDVVKPISDILRVERRDVLIDYLLAYPVYAYRYSWLTSNDIYETLMVDVEMMPIMTTTRILLAINTVQLWMDRVLLQIESVTVSDNIARQWNTWRKLYRVWEANRKVFLYPENWIEPELRDDKTPLFLELEKFLKQNEVTKDNVEQAYKTYLERLDQLSRMDIIGIYRETNQPYQESLPLNNSDYQNIVHAFGRTKEHPHLYHYRRRVAGEWTAWEKMDVQIDGDHFIPVMWRGRLRFYWLVFTKDQEEVPMSSIQSEGSYEMPAGVRWKIEIAWTELKDGKWIGKQLSKEALYTRFVYEEKPMSKDHFNHYKTVKWEEHRSWNEKGDLEKIKKEFINFFCEYDSSGNVQFTIVERNYLIHNLHGEFSRMVDDPYTIDGITYYSYPALENIKSTFDLTKNIIDGQPWGIGESECYQVGKFVVRFNGVTAINKSDAKDIHFNRSLYSNNPDGRILTEKDLLHNGYWPQNTDYWYHEPNKLANGYAHFPDGNIPLLMDGAGNYAFDTKTIDNLSSNDENRAKKRKINVKKNYIKNAHKSKYLVFPRQIPKDYTEGANIQIPYFFHKDNKNTFFVEKVSLYYDYYVIIGGPLSFASEIGPALVDTTSGTGITLDAGISSADYDIVRPEADIIPFGESWPPMETVKGYYKAAYRYHNFSHERVDDFLEKLHLEGLDGLLNHDFISTITDDMLFADTYKPTANVHSGGYYPHNKVDFSPEGAYSLYNWELFFHIPMLIANKLSQNQQFDEARNWYQYVFNPTNNKTGTLKKVERFWNFSPFFDKASTIVTIDSIMKSASLSDAIDRWANDPFKPHLIARTRPSAYMKNVVMKYLDNLIAWADNKFRTDSREAINEATLLYILALQILGRKPETIPARAKPSVQTYDSLDATGVLNDFGNAMVKVENVLLSSGAKRHYSKTFVTKSYFDPRYGWVSYDTLEYRKFSMKGDMYYFCTPPNEKLLQYWEILADRLFKIRNSQNIDGVTRELALYDPPIDPAILVKAAASGVSLAGILGDLNAPLPSYRFNVISQKASELVNEVKSLGGQLLSALEKKDAEQISLLRSSQEIKVLEAITDLKEKAIDESKNQWEVLKIQIKSTKQRQGHYKSLIDGGLIGKELLQLDSLKLSIPLQIAQGVTQGISAAIGVLPQIHSTPPSTEHGGVQATNVVSAISALLGTLAGVNNTVGSMAGINAGHERRKQDWELQYKLATIEVEQMNKQLIASEIRYAMAQVELRNHKIQMSNAQEMELAMRNKYTNEELYDWMIGQISFVYFQGYKLAYETAKKAERCFRYELNLDTSDYIQYGYWDSLKKGLLAGENLAYDLKRMEVAYLDKNKRQLELTKHVSLAALNPNALVALRNNKVCEFEIPEWLFDMDYPGQHMRRIKSVSISIPCVSGPYTSISAKLSLVSSKYRKSPFLKSGGQYTEDASDNRFTYMFGNIQSIATSNAQNDSGMFEMNFRDERYLPFEGSGAISKWSLELPAAYAQFDYNTISDIIIHIKYTALDGGSMKVKAKENVQQMMQAATKDTEGLYRFFDLKHEFSNEWHQMLNQSGDKTMALGQLKGRLPYLVQDGTLTIAEVKLFADTGFGTLLNKDALDPTSGWEAGVETPASSGVWTKQLAISGTDLDLDVDDHYLHFNSTTNIAAMKECWLVIHYTAVL